MKSDYIQGIYTCYDFFCSVNLLGNQELGKCVNGFQKEAAKVL